MRKVVSTEMSEESVLISVDFPESNDSSVPVCKWAFPLKVVNPRVALQIATLLVSDPTIPGSYAEKADQ